MEITKEIAKRLYNEASWLRNQLIEEFGEEFFQEKTRKDIKSFEEIKSFEDACEVLYIDPNNVINNAESPDEIAYKKLKIIIKAVNEGWKPNWKDTNEKKWYPWFSLSSGFGFFISVFNCDGSDTHVGSRFCFETKEKCDYVVNQFINIYKKFLI